jgi:hypothetical protein
MKILFVLMRANTMLMSNTDIITFFYQSIFCVLVRKRKPHKRPVGRKYVVNPKGRKSGSRQIVNQPASPGIGTLLEHLFSIIF